MVASAFGSRAAAALIPNALQESATAQYASGGVSRTGALSFVGTSQFPEITISRAAPANWPSKPSNRSPQAVVPMCRSAARASRNARSACRVGGGVRICGERKVSSSENVRVPATIFPSGRVDPVTIPIFRHAQQFCVRHLDNGKHLPAFRDQDFIRSPDNFEGAPKPDAFETVEPAFDREFVAELRRAPI